MADYQVLTSIGAGGMSEVYQALDDPRLRISGIRRERQRWRRRTMSQSACYVNLRVATGQARGMTTRSIGGGCRLCRLAKESLASITAFPF